MKNIGNLVCLVVELTSVAVLAGVALKRNNDCYKAECKRIEAEGMLALKDIQVDLQDMRIKRLERELEELKSSQEKTEEES